MIIRMMLIFNCLRTDTEWNNCAWMVHWEIQSIFRCRRLSLVCRLDMDNNSRTSHIHNNILEQNCVLEAVSARARRFYPQRVTKCVLIIRHRSPWFALTVVELANSLGQLSLFRTIQINYLWSHTAIRWEEIRVDSIGPSQKATLGVE